MIYITNVWLKPCPKRLFLPNREEYLLLDNFPPYGLPNSQNLTPPLGRMVWFSWVTNTRCGKPYGMPPPVSVCRKNRCNGGQYPSYYRPVPPTKRQIQYRLWMSGMRGHGAGPHICLPSQLSPLLPRHFHTILSYPAGATLLLPRRLTTDALDPTLARHPPPEAPQRWGPDHPTPSREEMGATTVTP
jgi:hypothetical protein